MNCMYKILITGLANSLRRVIKSAIYDAQSSFIKGRHLNNILIANEVGDEAHK